MNDNQKAGIVCIACTAIGIGLGLMIEPFHESCTCSSSSSLAGIFGISGFVGSILVYRWFIKHEFP